MNTIATTHRKNSLTYFNYIKLLSGTEIAIIIGSLLSSLIALILAVLNPIHYPYLTMPVSVDGIAAMPALTILLIISKMMYYKKNNSAWLVCAALLITLNITITTIFGLSSIMLTPYPRIDVFLNHLDHCLGFNLPTLMAWKRNNPIYLQGCTIAYYSWIYQIILLPILVTILGNYRRATRFYFSFVSALLVGSLIYYFWPTTAPATVMHSRYFTYGEHNLVQNFLLMRAGKEHLLPTSGLISFPSFHLIGATLVMLLIWKNKILRWPFLGLNIILTFATLYMGFHYLVDLIAGIAIAIICFYLSGIISKKYDRSIHLKNFAKSTRS